MHLSIVLIHLHSQVVRAHREEILLSEREPVLLIRCEVILILDAFESLQVLVPVKVLPSPMALSCVIVDKEADEYTRLLCFFFSSCFALVRPTGTSPV